METTRAGDCSATGEKILSDREKTRIAEAEKKATKLGYQTRFALAYLGESQTNAKTADAGIIGTFKQFNSTNLNGFKGKGGSFKHEDLANYKARLFIDKGMILNIEELGVGLPLAAHQCRDTKYRLGEQ